MAPHVIEISKGATINGGFSEVAIGQKAHKIPGTDHLSGDMESPGAKYAHGILLGNPNLVEVEDEGGLPCHPFFEQSASSVVDEFGYTKNPEDTGSHTGESE